MSYTLTRNLRLRLDTNLSTNSKYNLERLDLLGAALNVDTLQRTVIRSKGDIILQPNSNSIGGSGTGGSVQLGESGNPLSSFTIHAEQLNLDGAPGFKDQGAGGTRYLRLSYHSDLSGSTDTTADRELQIDLDGANRELVLGGNLRTAGGNLVATLTGNTNVTFPTSGTLATLADIISGTGDVASYATGWFPADGLSKSVAHNLASTDVVISIVDMSNDRIVIVDDIHVVDNNNITVTASELPGVSGWRIIVHS